MIILGPVISAVCRQARWLHAPYRPTQVLTHYIQNGLSPLPRNFTCAAVPSDDPVAIAAANKQKVLDNQYKYILEHTREPPILEKLRNDTAKRFPQAARMAVSPEQGAFLSWLVGALGVKQIIELGVFTGYSSVAMALALPSDGKLLALDRDPTAMAMAEEYWKEAGVENIIESRLGPALDTLNALVDAGDQFDQYDFAFVDADKRKYREYYEILLKLVRPGGTIAIDNVLWYGKVSDPEVQDKATISLRDLNDFLVKDPRIDASLVPIGDGLTLCRRLR